MRRPSRPASASAAMARSKAWPAAALRYLSSALTALSMTLTTMSAGVVVVVHRAVHEGHALVDAAGQLALEVGQAVVADAAAEAHHRRLADAARARPARPPAGWQSRARRPAPAWPRAARPAAARRCRRGCGRAWSAASSQTLPALPSSMPAQAGTEPQQSLPSGAWRTPSSQLLGNCPPQRPSACQPRRRPTYSWARGCHHCSSAQAQPSRAIKALAAAGPQLPAA